MRIERKKRMVRVRSRERTREIELERVIRVRTDLYGDYRVEDLLTDHLCAHPIVFSVFRTYVRTWSDGRRQAGRLDCTVHCLFDSLVQMMLYYVKNVFIK